MTQTPARTLPGDKHVTARQPAEKPSWAWMNGEFVRWDDCVLHVRSRAIMHAESVFEGVRAYWNASEEQLHVFRLADHLDRLQESMRILRMQPAVPPSLSAACIELLARNQFREDIHMMPWGYVGVGEGFESWGTPLDEGFFITAIPKGRDAVAEGVHVGVSSWRRLDDTIAPPRVKTPANYINARLALYEARTNGYDNALMLNTRGTLAEGPGACVFIVRKGSVCTPLITGSILESITRQTLIELFRERLNIQVVERDIDRTELYVTEEAFYCATGEEILPIVAVDGLSVGRGTRGPITEAIQGVFFDIAYGRDKSHSEWRTPVYPGPRATAR